MNFTLIKKIEELNDLCDDSLSITKYSIGWSCRSYESGSALSSLKNGGDIQSTTFEKMIDKALKYIKEHQDIIKVGGKTYKLVEEKN